ncbi:MAG TPA: hypothetical protein VGB06_09440 [Solirubrobacterales bacterium]
MALLVLVTLLLVGGYLVRDAGEAAMQMVGLGAWIAGFCTLAFLNERQSRRPRGDGRDQ